MARANLSRAAKGKGQLTFPISKLKVSKLKMCQPAGIRSDSLALRVYAYRNNPQEAKTSKLKTKQAPSKYVSVSVFTHEYLKITKEI